MTIFVIFISKSEELIFFVKRTSFKEITGISFHAA